MADSLTLMAVHAHPDDEASSTGGVLATYSDQGVQTIVVTCTNGEFGDAPGGIKPGQQGHDEEKVARIRLAELRESARILGISSLETLGYHDSGMPDWEYKFRPDAFCNVPLDEVADRIAGLIAKYRPQVLITYDDKGTYQHPDHVHASMAAQVAVEATSVGRPAKVYMATVRGSDWAKVRHAFIAAGEEMPEPEETDAQLRQRALESEERITTTIDIRPMLPRKRDALMAHGSQISESLFAKIPPDITESVFGFEHFIRASDTTGAPVPESDLFAGLRTGA